MLEAYKMFGGKKVKEAYYLEFLVSCAGGFHDQNLVAFFYPTLKIWDIQPILRIFCTILRVLFVILGISELFLRINSIQFRVEKYVLSLHVRIV